MVNLDTKAELGTQANRSHSDTHGCRRWIHVTIQEVLFDILANLVQPLLEILVVLSVGTGTGATQNMLGDTRPSSNR